MQNKQTFLKVFILFYLPLLVWMIAIFLLSSMPGNGQVYEMPWLMLLERKGAHIFEYFILTLLLFRIFHLYIPKEMSVHVVRLSFLCALLYAASDELHQLFVFGRTGKSSDILIDSIGIIVAVFLWKSKYFQTKILRENA